MNDKNNPLTMAGLVLVLAISPVPLASNRPVFWAIWAGFILLLAAIHCLNAPQSDADLPLLKKLRLLGVIIGLLLGYIIFQALSNTSVTPRASLLAGLRILSYWCFFWLIAVSVNSVERRQKMSEIIFYIVVFHGLVGLFLFQDIFTLPDVFQKSAYADSVTGTFINKNSFASYLGFGLLLGLANIDANSRQTNPEDRGGYRFFTPSIAGMIAGSTMLLAALILTNSRFGIASFLLASMVLLMLRFSWGHSSRILLVFAIVALVLLPGQNLRFDALGQDISTRLTLFGQVGDMILSRPWTGYGADSFPVAFQKFHQPSLNPDLVWDKAHNSYLGNWAELGLVFGSIPVLAGVILLLWLIKSSGHATNWQSRAGVAFITLAAIHSTADFSLEIQANLFLFLAVLAVALAESQDTHPPVNRFRTNSRKI